LLTENIRKPIKGSKDADFLLVFSKKHKAASSGWSSGPNQVGHNNRNISLLWRTPQKASYPNFPTIFKSKLEEFPHLPFENFICYLGSLKKRHRKNI